MTACSTTFSSSGSISVSTSTWRWRERRAGPSNEIELLDATGKVIATHPSKTIIRWIYKAEMELLLRVAGSARWSILGGFDGRPLLHETDAMIVQAWTDSG